MEARRCRSRPDGTTMDRARCWGLRTRRPFQLQSVRSSEVPAAYATDRAARGGHWLPPGRVGGSASCAGFPPVCQLCLAGHRGADADLASRRVEESADVSEIARHWHAARDASRLTAWRRLLETGAFGEATHDIVTVSVAWTGGNRGSRGKFRGFSVQDRTPAWLLKASRVHLQSSHWVGHQSRRAYRRR